MKGKKKFLKVLRTDLLTGVGAGDAIISKNDRRNSGDTLRQKINLIDIRHLIFDIQTMD